MGPRWTAVSLSRDNMDPPLGFDSSQLVHRVARIALDILYYIVAQVVILNPCREGSIQFGVSPSHLAGRFLGGIASFNS